MFTPPRHLYGRAQNEATHRVGAATEKTGRPPDQSLGGQAEELVALVRQEVAGLERLFGLCHCGLGGGLVARDEVLGPRLELTDAGGDLPRAVDPVLLALLLRAVRRRAPATTVAARVALSFNAANFGINGLAWAVVLASNHP
jgi:hypothetical protein